MKEGIKEGITYFPLDCHLDEKFDFFGYSKEKSVKKEISKVSNAK